jgi:hypothetical protein
MAFFLLASTSTGFGASQFSPVVIHSGEHDLLLTWFPLDGPRREMRLPGLPSDVTVNGFSADGTAIYLQTSYRPESGITKIEFNPLRKTTVPGTAGVGTIAVRWGPVCRDPNSYERERGYNGGPISARCNPSASNTSIASSCRACTCKLLRNYETSWFHIASTQVLEYGTSKIAENGDSGGSIRATPVGSTRASRVDHAQGGTASPRCQADG